MSYVQSAPNQLQHSLPPISQENAFRETLDALAQHMIASMDLTRADRLWPADPMVFQTNALNLSHGACGTAVFLQDWLGEVPHAARGWLSSQPVDNSTYPPGLYSGTAGIAWSFAELGMLERACDIFQLIPDSPLAFKGPDIYNGAAGWGLAALALYLRTHDDRFLTLACRAADHLTQTANTDDKGKFWRGDGEEITRLGFAYGGSGIALFLLYLWRVTSIDTYLVTAREAMEFEIAHGRERDGTLVWGSTTDVEEHRPYWLRGGAGVATALIRFATVLNEPRYLDLARKAAGGCAVFFSVAPHLFEGLASMGETLLDLYMATGDHTYLQAARQKAEQILLFRMDRPQGAAFPGRYLLRISHDYGVGGAGIGIYLQRVLELRPRRFHDIFAATPQPRIREALTPGLIQ